MIHIIPAYSYLLKTGCHEDNVDLDLKILKCAILEGTSRNWFGMRQVEVEQ